MRQFVHTLVFLIFWVVLNSAAEAAKKTPGRIAFMKPVRVLSIQPDVSAMLNPTWSAEVSYELACGESFRGILVREKGATTRPPVRQSRHIPHHKNGQLTVEVAVVVDRSEAFCSSLPTETSFALPVRAGVSVRSIKMNDPKRVVLEEALDVGIADHGVVLGWQSSCQTLAGVILKPLIDRTVPKIEISLARFPREDGVKQISATCLRQIRRTTIKGVNLPVGSITVAERPGKIETAYFTRLIAPQSLVKEADGRLVVKWQKHCREREVGLLFLGPAGHDVAIVSAVMPSVSCHGAKSTDKRYVLPSLIASKGRPIRPANQKQLLEIGRKYDFNYSLLPATSIDLKRAGQGEELTATTNALHCGEAMGIIVGGDAYGNVAIGVLAGTPQSVCTISQSKFNWKLGAPIVAPSGEPMPRVFGLRVFGTVLN